MALNPKLSDIGANAAVNAMAALCNTGFLDVYNGAQPATCSDVLVGNGTTSGVLLASMTLANPAFGTGSLGVAIAQAIGSDLAANANGIASWFRVYKADHATAVFDGSVGTSNANLIVDTVTFVMGATIAITSFTLTQSKG